MPLVCESCGAADWKPRMVDYFPPELGAAGQAVRLCDECDAPSRAAILTERSKA